VGERVANGDDHKEGELVVAAEGEHHLQAVLDAGHAEQGDTDFDRLPLVGPDGQAAADLLQVEAVHGDIDSEHFQERVEVVDGRPRGQEPVQVLDGPVRPTAVRDPPDRVRRLKREGRVVGGPEMMTGDAVFGPLPPPNPVVRDRLVVGELLATGGQTNIAGTAMSGQILVDRLARLTARPIRTKLHSSSSFAPART
jgi:hypothetical protein